MKLSVEVDIDAPPRIVWDVWRDIERWPEWTASISSVEIIDPRERGSLAVGLRARVRQPKLPPAVWKVTSVDEGRAFTWVSASPGARVTAIHRIEPRSGGSRATLSIDFAGPLGLLVGHLARSISTRYLELEAAGVKARSEERSR